MSVACRRQFVNTMQSPALVVAQAAERLTDPRPEEAVAMFCLRHATNNREIHNRSMQS